MITKIPAAIVTMITEETLFLSLKYVETLDNVGVGAIMLSQWTLLKYGNKNEGEKWLYVFKSTFLGKGGTLTLIEKGFDVLRHGLFMPLYNKG